jgi:sortase A
MPGRVGDFAVAGHRTTYLHPFYDLNELRKSDPIIVETKTTWFTYRVHSTEVVDPHDVATVAPVPNHPGAIPHRKWLTFTTCNPRYSATQRLVVHGLLTHQQPRSAGIPNALRRPATDHNL